MLRDIDLSIGPRTRLCVAGPNGVGKTTLLHLLAGELAPEAGEVRRQPDGLKVRLVRQEPERSSTVVVRDELARMCGIAGLQEEFDEATAELAAGAEGAADRYDRALGDWLEADVAGFDARVDEAAAELGLAPSALDLPTAHLSGGQVSRVGLAALLLTSADVTLLDEPTNNLDTNGLAVLDGWIERNPGGLVVVSHDRGFLERHARSVLELDEHARSGTLFEGGWQAYLDERATAAAHEQDRYATYVNQRDRLRQRAQQQREWVDRGASRARKRPADGDKIRRSAQIAQTEKLAGKARATEQAIDRLETVDKPWEGWDLRFTVNEAPRSATVVATFDGLVIRRGTFVLGPLDDEIRYGERVGLAGPNGSGKSSLIDVLLGRRSAADGSCRLGPNVVVGELGQRRDEFSRGDRSVLDVITGSTSLLDQDARSVMAKFGLDHDAMQRPAESLSPGERTRATLAMFQAQGVNLLVLDEPTNHLDLPAIEQLESALEHYGGTLLLVSHDERLLENVALDRTITLPDPARPDPAG